ncbi:MAG TPA: CAP domain-containing protein [Terracidiphilus sp.]|nr:CAP domain-containing protein [Terracidiphilus sp.]
MRSKVLMVCVLLAMPVALMGQAYGNGREANGAIVHSAAEQLFALANRARAEQGAPPLEWDPALAIAALRHCQRMAAEGSIAHRYNGEMSVSERAQAAGAHFSLIEENVAVGEYPAQIQDAWLHSPEHRANLLNPQVNRVGIGVVKSRGVLYAVEDFDRGVEVLTAAEVEREVEGLMRVSGIAIRPSHGDARAACAMNQGLPSRLSEGTPQFVMRWQGADLSRLPSQLADRLGSGRYRSGAVGACPAESSQSSFTMYRVAVLLY